MFTPRTLYLYLLAAGLLTTACQRDKPARTEPAAAPALADTLGLDSLANPVATADTAAPRRTWHRLAQRTNPRAPLIVYRGRRRAPRGLFDSTPPPGEATLFDVARKASEYFQINPRQAAEVRGREGTVLRLAAGTLVDAQQRPATGAVWVELKECYEPADMVLSNLSTATTDGQPLQTAGMVLVRATAGGRPLQVAAGRTVRLEMPAAHGRPLPDMRLYYGQGTAPVRWVAAPETAAPEAATETIYTDATPMPRYGNGPADFNRLVRYPREALAAQAQGVVFASFVVDETGRVLRPRILRGLGHGCDEEVLRALRQTSGHWTPGQRNGEFVKVKMTLPIRFSFQEGMMTAADANAPTADDSAETVVTAAAPAAEGEPEATPTDRYVFRCSQLGWLNADRPLSGAGTATLLAPTDSDDATAVRLVLRGATPTVLAGQTTDGGYQFDQLPAGQRAVLVGLRYQGGTPYLAWQELTTGADAPAPLVFQETTLEELERRLGRL